MEDIRPIIVNDISVIDYRNLLILFLKKENDIIRKITNIDYIIEEDINEIYTWEYNICKELIGFLSLINDHFLNPWCHINMNDMGEYNCDKCKYGIRHGICEEQNSTYHTIISGIRKKKIFEAVMPCKLKKCKFITDLNGIHKLYRYKTDMLVSYEELKQYEES